MSCEGRQMKTQARTPTPGRKPRKSQTRAIPAPVQAQAHRKPGRPRKEPIDLTKAESVAAMGGTNEQIAFALGVGDGTLKQMRRDRPELDEAIIRGKDRADIQIVGALYNKAKGGGRCPHCHKVILGLAGDTTAQIFWLKNRKPDEWRDRHDVNNSGKVDHGGTITVRVVKTK